MLWQHDQYHNQRFPPGASGKKTLVAKQRMPEQTPKSDPSFHHNDGCLKKITKSLTASITRDLRSHSGADKQGFCFRPVRLQAEVHHPIPASLHRHDCTPLYSDTNAPVMESMRNSCPLTATCESWTSSVTYCGENYPRVEERCLANLFTSV